MHVPSLSAAVSMVDPRCSVGAVASTNIHHRVAFLSSHPARVKAASGRLSLETRDLGRPRPQAAAGSRAAAEGGRGTHRSPSGTVRNWETSATTVALKHVPAIVEFLGYVPFPEPTNLAERLRLYRKINGISRQELAEQLGADESTVWRWEAGLGRPGRRLGVRVAAVLSSGRSAQVRHPPGSSAAAPALLDTGAPSDHRHRVHPENGGPIENDRAGVSREGTAADRAMKRR